MAGFYNHLINKLRFARYAVSSNVHLLSFGAIYACSYANWKHDPQPLIFCMYSDSKYTHAVNLHYLSQFEKQWLGRTIYLLKKAGQVMDGKVFYNFFKMRMPKIPQIAYRVYFTNLLDAKLVSAGLTPLSKMEYTFRDPFIIALNEMISETQMRRPPTRISYNADELRNKIISAQNAIPISQQKVGEAFGRAPYIR